MTKSRELYYEVISLHVGIAKRSYDDFMLILKMSLYSYPIKESLSQIYKDLLPIETLPKLEKQGFWDEVNKAFPNKNKEDKILLCKNMYVLGSLL
jgi:hypothetical protein